MQKRNIFYYLKKKNIYKKRRPNFCSPYKEIPPLKNLSIWNQIIQKRRNNCWTKLQLSIPRWVLLSIFLKVFVMMNNWYDVKNTTYIWRWVNLKYTPKNWTKIIFYVKSVSIAKLQFLKIAKILQDQNSSPLKMVNIMTFFDILQLQSLWSKKWFHVNSG